jgi:hypothetical protein
MLALLIPQSVRFIVFQSMAGFYHIDSLRPLGYPMAVAMLRDTRKWTSYVLCFI